jgi:hypothetical protein
LSRDEHALDVLAIVAHANPIANAARDAAAIDAVLERLAAYLGSGATLTEIARGMHLSP